MEVTTPDGVMTVFTAHPAEGGPFPVAVLYMDGVGYREQVKENARRFAGSGFYCVAPDLYYRSGKGVHFDMTNMSTTGLNEEERARMMQVVATVSPEQVAVETGLIFDAIAGDPAAAAGPRVCVGYCMGARIVLHAMSALSDRFVAGAGIHPGALVTQAADSPHHDLDGVRGEMYFAFSEQDRADTGVQVTRMNQEMGQRGVRGVAERIPNTVHGFAMADLPVHNPEAAEDHFERTVDLWNRNL